MKYIKLTNSEVMASIDDDDYDRVMSINTNWMLGTGAIYSTRHFSLNFKPSHIALARFILNVHTTRKFDVDHKDRNIFNNSKSNLRKATRVQNAANKPKRSDNTSGFIGIHKDPYYPDKWRGKIVENHRTHSTKKFEKAEDAARARDELAIKYHGEFAQLNFPKN